MKASETYSPEKLHKAWKELLFSHSEWESLEIDGGPRIHRRSGLPQKEVRRLNSRLKQPGLSEDEESLLGFELLVHENRDRGRPRIVAPTIAEFILVGFALFTEGQQRAGERLMRDFFRPDGEFSKWEAEKSARRRSQLNEPQAEGLTTARGDSDTKEWAKQFKNFLYYNLRNEGACESKDILKKLVEQKAKELLTQLIQSGAL